MIFFARADYLIVWMSCLLIGTVTDLALAMEEHRANPVCASCHMRMDPLGFALENFNGIGQWRTTEGVAKTPIDTSGQLPDGTKFQGPIELRHLLLSKRDQFAYAVTEKLLTYALGRGTEYYDQSVIRKIRREAAPDYHWSSLILGIVKSEPFQTQAPSCGIKLSYRRFFEPDLPAVRTSETKCLFV